MTINNEEKTNIEKPIQLLNSEDRVLLVSLLNEYQEKLVNLCGKIEKNIIYSSFSIFFDVTPFRNARFLIINILFSTFIIIFSYSAFSFPQNTIFAIILLISISYIAIYFKNEEKKLKILTREAKTISLRLEKIVRIASQIEDHLSRAIPTVITKIELDLRLADAESALEYYQEIVNKQEKRTYILTEKTEKYILK
jgi:hypothetical protein